MSAVAQESRGRFQPVFLTLSGGFPLIREAGMPAEFFPSYSQIGLSKQEWSSLLAMRVAEAVRLTGARVVVVDHVMPPSSFGILKAVTTGVQLVWSRRGLWRAGRNEDYLRMIDDFHTVVEPDDLAGPIDVGATVRQRHKVQRVGSVVLVQPDQYLPRGAARERLGLPAEGRVVLVQLSDSRASRLRALIGQARQAITKAAGSEQVHVFAPLHPLHRRDDLAHINGVLMAPVYPIATYFNAFDGVISTAGYNSYHEIIVSSLPAVFVARDTGSLDDQERRARFAELCGRAHWAPSLDDPAFGQAVASMLRPEEPRIAEATATELGPMLGAREFADLIERLASDAQSQEFAVGEVEMSRQTEEALATKLVSGATVGDGAVETVIVVAVEHTTQQLNTLVSQMDELQASHPQMAPVFLISEASADALVGRGFVFESAMNPDEWDMVSPETFYAEYLRSRVSGLQHRYGAHWVLEPQPGTTLGGVEDLKRLARHSPSGDEVRSFSLRLPTPPDSEPRALVIEVSSSLYVPRKLEELGLARYEPMSLAVWLAILARPQKGAAFDVGANVGPYSWLAAALSRREVVAFEPVDELIEAIAIVSRDNDLGIKLERSALSDHEGTAPLYMSDRTDSSNSLASGFRESSRSIEVTLRTLDAYVEETGYVPFAVKIDTETHEPEVLAGAGRVLSRNRPWLIIEVLAGRTEERLMDVLSAFDYTWFPITEELPFTPSTTIEGDSTYEHTNWLLSPEPPDVDFWSEVSEWRSHLDACTVDHN